MRTSVGIPHGSWRRWRREPEREQLAHEDGAKDQRESRDERQRKRLAIQHHAQRHAKHALQREEQRCLRGRHMGLPDVLEHGAHARRQQHQIGHLRPELIPSEHRWRRKRLEQQPVRKAHEAQERLANIEKEGESILQEAREKQAQILKEAAETRDAIVEQAQAKARSEGARLLDEAKMAIEQEKKAAIADIRQQVATLSVDIAEKVLRKNLKDDKSQMDLIDRMLDEVSAK